MRDGDEIPRNRKLGELITITITMYAVVSVVIVVVVMCCHWKRENKHPIWEPTITRILCCSECELNGICGWWASKRGKSGDTTNFNRRQLTEQPARICHRDMKSQRSVVMVSSKENYPMHHSNFLAPLSLSLFRADLERASAKQTARLLSSSLDRLDCHSAISDCQTRTAPLHRHAKN